ncbi:MAG TPA: hypothetical protein VG253_17990 [Streptosporangiaceae bacterium]|jgi:hypothetical protein|nr:hypothetical protein [Streptosporangiaceae bacterium]
MTGPTDPQPAAAPDDPLPEALSLSRGAAQAGLGLKLLGGLGVRVLCPTYPPRLRSGQDIDFACLSKGRKKVAAWLADNGCEPDRRFNNLNGDRQMYFNAPSGRPVDVMVDQLTMCHTLDFRPSFAKLPFTVDAVDLLLSKLQIVELNEKDARDIAHLLSALPLGGEGLGAEGQGSGAAIDTGRFAKVLGGDWGWYRTVTANLDKLPALLEEHPGLIPPSPHHDPLAQARRLRQIAEEAPKGVKWRLRANIGDRVRWYELPEEVAH